MKKEEKAFALIQYVICHHSLQTCKFQINEYYLNIYLLNKNCAHVKKALQFFLGPLQINAIIRSAEQCFARKGRQLC